MGEAARFHPEEPQEGAGHAGRIRTPQPDRIRTDPHRPQLKKKGLTRWKITPREGAGRGTGTAGSPEGVQTIKKGAKKK